MIARWVKDLVLDTVDPWIVQEPDFKPEDILAGMQEENEQGQNFFMGSKHYNVVLMVRYSTPWVGDVHLFAKQKNPWKIVETVNRSVDTIFANTDYVRLEMRTHLPNVCKLAERCGWKKEGEHPYAVALKDGTMVTEYSYGVTNE